MKTEKLNFIGMIKSMFSLIETDSYTENNFFLNVESV